jgi:hypothetical protein
MPSRARQRAGNVLATVLVGMAIVLITVGSFLYVGTQGVRMVQRWRTGDQMMLVAQSAMERAKMDILNNFTNYAENAANYMTGFNWFNTWNSTSLGQTYVYAAPQNVAYSNCAITITIVSVSTSGWMSRDVVVQCRATNSSVPGLVRGVQETIRYQMGRSPIFNHAYFINNFGWLYGSGITVQGDVRANGNFAFQSGPKVNGDVFAATNSEIGAAGTISGTHSADSLSSYQNNSALSNARPANPVSAGGISWPAGYDGVNTNMQYQQGMEMPFLGDLKDYQSLASNYNGTITQGTNVLVNKVYDGNGPDGLAGTPDRGCLILNGSPTNPIVVTGPVVVTGDVIIKGTISGQGMIYAGRNVHIVSNLTYQTPPIWPKPDNNPAQTMINTSTANMVGLAAKGSIILGDYTQSSWISSVSSYIQPSFTHSYKTDPTDATNGYGNASNNYTFDGNYNNYDGGFKVLPSGGTAQRRYYESSVATNLIRQLAGTNAPAMTRVDAILYCNHLITGKVGAITFNGTVISRDEAIIYSSTIKMNWDIRLWGSGGGAFTNMLVSLPMVLAQPNTVFWQEIP